MKRLEKLKKIEQNVKTKKYLTKNTARKTARAILNAIRSGLII